MTALASAQVTRGPITRALNQVFALDGSASAPSIAFGSATGTGFYQRVADNAIGLSFGGTAAIDFNTANTISLGSARTIAWSSTTAPSGTADTSLSRGAAGAVKFTATGTNVPLQLRGTQGTAPTCSTNCGTSPSVVGTDTAGIVTMGASGVPASGWVVTFNGTWAAAPSCSVVSALAGMVVGKMPIVVATTTTTITVTTNGTAPSTSDKYAFQCFGVS